MTHKTRPSLLERLRDAADVMAWNDFFACYWPVVFSYARHRGCSEHTAEEIVQEVLLKVFEKREVFRYDPAQGRFRNWLHRIVNNQVAEHRRRPSERIRARGGDSSDAPLEQAADGPDTEWDASFDRAVMAALVQVVQRQVNPRDFVAFELTVLQDRAPGDVARLLGMSRNMVYKARREVLQRLRQLAGDYADDGRLTDQVRAALESLPDAAIGRSVSRRITKTIEQNRKATL
jgi:RNA polymerase sigma-70 factor (ECF subfamily)